MKYLFYNHRKFLFSFFLIISTCLILFAQDFPVPEDGVGDGGDSFSSFDSFDSFGSFGSFEDSGSSPLSFGMKTEITARGMLGGDHWKGYFNDDDVRDLVFLDPSAKLNFGYSAGQAEFFSVLKADKDTLTLYPEDIIEEFTARAYLGNFIVEAGKMKVVWGKGDELHVVDNFNANDYTDFIFPDYIDRRLAEPMFRLIWNGDNNLRAEAVYTPIMTADRFADEGVWVPGQMSDISGVAAKILMEQAGAALAGGNVPGLIAALSAADSIIPETTSFDYGQAGLRFTGTAGVFDWGVSYYIGHYKQPTVDWSAYEASSEKQLPELHYDRLQVFGLEGAAAIGRFNFRGEAAYYLTDDVAGDDPWVHNNSVNWVVGFDVDLPIHNVNVNIQNNGAWVLSNNKIVKALDADYNADDRYTNNKIVFQISDTFFHEKLDIEMRLLWGIERGDFILMPRISYAFTPELEFALSGMYITGKDDSEFSYWQDNSFVQVGVKYTF